MNEVITFVQNVGFPIAVAAYLLVRLDKRLEGVQTALERLIDRMAKDEKKDGGR